jgi:hypothetical protein
MWSHPELPLAMPEADLEVIIKKGKAFEGDTSTAEPGNFPSPSVENPFSSSQLPSRLFFEVSCFLNFGSVPAEFSPPGIGLEGEILVTTLSPEVVPWHRPKTTGDFPTPSFTTPPLITVVATTHREASPDSNPLVFSLNPPLLPLPPRSSFPVFPIQAPSPPSSPPPNIPMAGENPPMTRMEAIIASRYAPLLLPQPLNALLADAYLKQLPKFTGEGDIAVEEHLEASYSFIDDHVIMHAYVWMRIFIHSLEGKDRKWFRALPPGSIDGIKALDNSFLRQWGDKKYFMYYMTKFGSLKRKEGESVSDFSKRFNKM